MTRIGIIGGGPAGFFAAIQAAESNKDARVTIFEATRRPLQKVLLSGGGRCNVTHHCFDPTELATHYPRGNRELLGPFHSFQARDTVAWFEKRGVKLKTESDGRIFPTTDLSSSIADCVIDAANKAGVTLDLGARISKIQYEQVTRDGSHFLVTLSTGSVETFDRILLATGSQHGGYQLAHSLGHAIVPPVPSLFTFKVTDSQLCALSGIGFPDVEVSLIYNEKAHLSQRGALLITHWGLSGPAVLKLSAWGARKLHECGYKATIRVNLLPTLQREDIDSNLRTFKELYGKKHVATESLFGFPKRYWHYLLERTGIGQDLEWAHITRQLLTGLRNEMLSAQFQISGKGTFKEEFVTCGGVALNEVDFRTMESKVCPGLYLAGEILDIDGVTGGFNFQSCWTTGWIAGNHLARQ